MSREHPQLQGTMEDPELPCRVLDAAAPFIFCLVSVLVYTGRG